MRNKKIIISVALILAIVFLSMPVTAVRVQSDIISGTFECLPSEYTGNTISRTFNYTDSYFSASGMEKNPHLRTMSLDLALTAFGSYYANDNAAYTKSLLNDIGYYDISVEQMDGTPTADSIGSVIAHKSTAYGEVIAVAIRGGYYGREWENTLEIGETGDIKGFGYAAKKMLDRVKAYKQKNSLQNAKLWISGYSRAGAVADLMGKYINENVSDYGISADDVYVYTFEAPAASCTAPKYENIHNAYADGDIVTKLFPREWGFSNVGVPEPLGGSNIYIYRKHFDGSGISNNTDVIYSNGFLRTVKAAPITVSEFEDEFLTWLTALADRSLCARNSEYISRFVSLFMSRDTYEARRLAKYMSGVITNLYGGPLYSFGMLGLLDGDLRGEIYETSLSYLSGNVIKAFEASDHASYLSEAEFSALKADIPFLIRFAVPVIKSDLTINDPFTHICTFLGNVDEILAHHRQEFVLPLTESHDDYYSPISVEGASITIDETTAEVLSVRLSGKKLVPGTDYTVEYKDSAGVFIEPNVSGKYIAVITGVGSYSGVAEKEFTAIFPHIHEWAFSSFGDIANVKCISPGCTDYVTGKAHTVRLSVSDKVYDGKAAKVNCMISYGFPAEIDIGDIVITDEQGREVSPVEPGRYTACVTISEHEDGDNSARERLTFDISPIDISKHDITIAFADNSSDVMSIICSGELLFEGADYTLVYRDENGEIKKPEAPGKYTVTVEGIGHYTGTYSEQFEIRSLVPLIAALLGLFLIIAAATMYIVFKHKKS